MEELEKLRAERAVHVTAVNAVLTEQEFRAGPDHLRSHQQKREHARERIEEIDQRIAALESEE